MVLHPFSALMPIFAQGGNRFVGTGWNGETIRVVDFAVARTVLSREEA